MFNQKGIYVALATTATILFLMDSCSSATVKKTETQNYFEQEGFILIGNMSQDSISSGGPSTLSKRKSISLYLSAANARETQLGALQICKRFQGDLLFILNRAQFEDVQLATHGIGEGFWTSAVYDEALRDYTWFALNIPVDPTFKRSEAACSQATTQFGLAVSGSLTSFGLCSSTTVSRLRYICRV